MRYGEDGTKLKAPSLLFQNLKCLLKLVLLLCEKVADSQVIAEGQMPASAVRI